MATYYALVYRPPDNDTAVPAVALSAGSASELQAQGELLVDATLVYPAQPANHWDEWAADIGGPLPFTSNSYSSTLFRGSTGREIAASGIREASEQITLYTKATGDWFVIQYAANSPLVTTGGDTQLYSYGGNFLYDGSLNDLSIRFVSFGNNFTLPSGYFSISAMRIWGRKVAEEPEPASFWTNLINCREVDE